MTLSKQDILSKLNTFSGNTTYTNFNTLDSFTKKLGVLLSMCTVTKQDILNTLNTFYGNTVYSDFNKISRNDLLLAVLTNINLSSLANSNTQLQSTITKQYIAATDLSAYKAVRINNNNQLVYADSSSPQVVGVVTSNCVTGQLVDVVVLGIIHNTSWNWDTTKLLYVTSNGTLTQTAPSTGYIIQIGDILDATTINVDVDILQMDDSSSTWYSETTDYKSRVQISDSTVNKIDKLLVKPLKNAGIDLSKVDCGLFLGSGPNDYLQKLFYPSGVSSTLTANSATGLKVSQAGGLAGDGVGWLDTNYNYVTQNLALNNRFLGIYMLSSSYNWYAIGNGNLTYSSNTFFKPKTYQGYACEAYFCGSNQLYYSGKGFKSVCSDSGGLKGYTKGAASNYISNTPYSSNTDTNTSIALLRTTSGGSSNVSNAVIGGYFISPALTASQIKVVSESLDSFFTAIGRSIVEPTALFFGDEITLSNLSNHDNSYAAKVAVARNLTEINKGVSNTVLQDTNNTANNGYTRYVNDVIYMRPSEIYIMYGTNDLAQVFAGTAGYSLTKFQTQLNAIVSDLKATDVSRIVLASPIPLKSTVYSANQASTTDYQTCRNIVRTIAVNQQVYFADCYTAFTSNSGGWDSLLSDNINPNVAGCTLISQTVLSATLVT